MEKIEVNGVEYESTCTRDGFVYEFDRVAIKNKKGGIEFEQMRDDEVLMFPGGIYRLKESG